jgi:hypothetical protein
MNIRFSSRAVTAALGLLAASLTHADSDAAVDACVKAFIAANIPAQHPVTVQTIDAAPGERDDGLRPYKIVLTATGLRSGDRLAIGTCMVDRRGEAISLNGRRLKAYAADATPR